MFVDTINIANSIAENSEFRKLTRRVMRMRMLTALHHHQFVEVHVMKILVKFRRTSNEKNSKMMLYSVHRTNELVPSPTHYN